MIRGNVAIVAGVMAICIFGVHLNALALSESDADAIVAQEMATQHEREVARRAKLLEVPALQESRIERKGRTILMRRVEPSPVREEEVAEIEAETGSTEAKSSVRLLDRRVQKNFTFFVSVFDQTTTEIQSPEHPGFAAIFGFGLKDLPAVVDIETEEAKYTVFSIVQHVEAETATPRSRSWAVRPPGELDYAIHSESGDPAPAAFVEATDLLHQHYLENQARFATDARRAEALQAARDRNPLAAPRETVINYSPLGARSAKE